MHWAKWRARRPYPRPQFGALRSGSSQTDDMRRVKREAGRNSTIERQVRSIPRTIQSKKPLPGSASNAGTVISTPASLNWTARAPRPRNVQTTGAKRDRSRRGRLRTKSISAPPTSSVGMITRTLMRRVARWARAGSNCGARATEPIYSDRVLGSVVVGDCTLYRP